MLCLDRSLRFVVTAATTSAFKRMIAGHDKFKKMANTEKTYSSIAYPPSGNLVREQWRVEALDE